MMNTKKINFDHRIWEIPKDRMKMGKAQIIPLQEQVVKILREQKEISQNEYIFPARNGRNRLKHIHLSAPLSILHKIGYKGRQTLHGFRTTFSTFANDSGQWSSDAIEAQLAHKTQGVRGVYNKANYINERTRMMAWWANNIDLWRSL